MTLTLGKKYKVKDEEREGIYIVDPYFEIPSLFEEEDGNNVVDVERLNDFVAFYSEHADVINQLASRQFFKEYSSTGFLDRDVNPYRPYYKAACFYKVYSQRFSDEFLLNAQYVTHWIDVDMSKETTDSLFKIAEGLVKHYAKAKMVVTSRIHAGLPCLGMGTPVVFIASPQLDSFNAPGRLEGLVELFRVLNLENAEFSCDDPVLNSVDLFTLNTTFENKNDWKPFANRLDRQLSAFMSDGFDQKSIAEIRNMAFFI